MFVVIMPSGDLWHTIYMYGTRTPLTVHGLITLHPILLMYFYTIVYRYKFTKSPKKQLKVSIFRWFKFHTKAFSSSQTYIYHKSWTLTVG